MITEVEINGKIYPYTECSQKNEYNSKWDDVVYLGVSQTYIINGTKNHYEKPHHFWYSAQQDSAMRFLRNRKL